MKRTRLALGMAALLAAGGTSMALPAAAEDENEVIYGRELMTEQERIEHRMKLRALKTEQEREAYRMEHHEQMQKRAQEQGKVLPAQPREYGQPGRGQGMGPRDGTGMGQGRSGQR